MNLEQIHTGPGFLGVLADTRVEGAHRAHVMLRMARRDLAHIESLLADVAGLTALHQISGEYDLVAIVEAPHAEALDALITRITLLRGVHATMVSRLRPLSGEAGARSFAA